MPPEQPIAPVTPPQTPPPVPEASHKLLWSLVLLLLIVGGVSAYGYYFYKPVQNAQLAQTATSTWQTYRNEEYGFEFKYPENTTISEASNKQGEKSNYIYVYRDQEENGIISFDIQLANEVHIDPANKLVDTISVDGKEAKIYSFWADKDTHIIVFQHGERNYFVHIKVVLNYASLPYQILSTFKFIDWQTYSNEEYGFEITLPSDWVIEERRGFQVNGATKSARVFISFASPETIDWFQKEPKCTECDSYAYSEADIHVTLGTTPSLPEDTFSEGQVNIGNFTWDKFHGTSIVLTTHYVLISNGKNYNFFMSGSGGDKETSLKQILSTFKFTE